MRILVRGLEALDRTPVIDMKPVLDPVARLAPFGEPEIPAAIADVLGDEGTGVVTGATVTGVRRDGRGRSVLRKTAAGGERELACGQVLVAAGRRPVSAGLNLPAVGVRTGGRGEILTGTRQRSGNPRIWAAGDVTGGPRMSTPPRPRVRSPPPTTARGKGRP